MRRWDAVTHKMVHYWINYIAKQKQCLGVALYLQQLFTIKVGWFFLTIQKWFLYETMIAFPCFYAKSVFLRTTQNDDACHV